MTETPLIVALVCLPILPLVLLVISDRRHARQYREHFRREDARLAARTAEEKHTDAMIACILVAGDFYPFIREPDLLDTSPDRSA